MGDGALIKVGTALGDPVGDGALITLAFAFGASVDIEPSDAFLFKAGRGQLALVVLTKGSSTGLPPTRVMNCGDC